MHEMSLQDYDSKKPKGDGAAAQGVSGFGLKCTNAIFVYFDLSIAALKLGRTLVVTTNPGEVYTWQAPRKSQKLGFIVHVLT